MTSSRRTIVIFAALWLSLAAYQAVRTVSVCFDGTLPGLLQWMLQFTLLLAPLIVLHRNAALHNGQAQDVRRALALILLTYVPVTLALKTGEICAGR